MNGNITLFTSYANKVRFWRAGTAHSIYVQSKLCEENRINSHFFFILSETSNSSFKWGVATLQENSKPLACTSATTIKMRHKSLIQLCILLANSSQCNSVEWGQRIWKQITENSQITQLHMSVLTVVESWWDKRHLFQCMFIPDYILTIKMGWMDFSISILENVVPSSTSKFPVDRSKPKVDYSWHIDDKHPWNPWDPWYDFDT